jgi:hypothetical protein
MKPKCAAVAPFLNAHFGNKTHLFSGFRVCTSFIHTPKTRDERNKLILIALVGFHAFINFLMQDLGLFLQNLFAGKSHSFIRVVCQRAPGGSCLPDDAPGSACSGQDAEASASEAHCIADPAALKLRRAGAFRDPGDLHGWTGCTGWRSTWLKAGPLTMSYQTKQAKRSSVPPPRGGTALLPAG